MTQPTRFFYVTVLQPIVYEVAAENEDQACERVADEYPENYVRYSQPEEILDVVDSREADALSEIIRAEQQRRTRNDLN